MFTHTHYTSQVYQVSSVRERLFLAHNRNEGQLLEHEHTHALNVTNLNAYQIVPMKCLTVLIPKSIVVQVMTDQTAFANASSSSPIVSVPLAAAADARYHM